MDSVQNAKLMKHLKEKKSDKNKHWPQILSQKKEKKNKTQKRVNENQKLQTCEERGSEAVSTKVWTKFEQQYLMHLELNRKKMFLGFEPNFRQNGKKTLKEDNKTGRYAMLNRHICISKASLFLILLYGRHKVIISAHLPHTPLKKKYINHLCCRFPWYIKFPILWPKCLFVRFYNLTINIIQLKIELKIFIIIPSCSLSQDWEQQSILSLWCQIMQLVNSTGFISLPIKHYLVLIMCYVVGLSECERVSGTEGLATTNCLSDK